MWSWESGRRRDGNFERKIFEEITAKKFQNLMRNINSHIQEAQKSHTIQKQKENYVWEHQLKIENQLKRKSLSSQIQKDILNIEDMAWITAVFLITNKIGQDIIEKNSFKNKQAIGKVAQLSSVTQLCLTLCDPMDCSMPGFTVHHQLMSIALMIPSNHLILCHPLLLLPSIYPSFRIFSSELVLHIRCPKYWSFSFNISPSNEHSGLISFSMDWLDILEVQGTLKSLLQHKSSKASILQHSAFFIVQRSHPYMTTGKTIVLTRWNFVSKVMPLLFNMLSRSVIAFRPRSKRF